MTGLREDVEALSPPWLRRTWGYRYLYALAASYDAITDAVAYGVKAGNPGFDATADRMLGEERSMPRGPHESRTDYVARLRRWRDAKSRLGNALELARQLSGYLRDGAGDSLRISVIGNGTVAGTPPVVTVETDGTEAYDQASATSWCGAEWDGDTDSWARFWIVIECDPRYTRATTLGIAGDRTARSFGSTMPVAVCDGIRSIVLQWKAAHAANLAVILTFGDSGPLVPSGWARLGDRSPMFCYFRGRE